jgi:hypothetical protein
MICADVVQLEHSLLEARSNTLTLSLRIVGDNEKGNQCLGVITGPPSSWEI